MDIQFATSAIGPKQNYFEAVAHIGLQAAKAVDQHQLAKQGRNDTGVRLRVADANRRVGDIRQRLGQFDSADDSYSRAVAIYDKAGGTIFDGSPVALEIVRIRNKQGNMRWLAHHTQEAQLTWFIWSER